MSGDFFRELDQKLNIICENDETADSGEIVVSKYQTRHYDMCPTATKLYDGIEEQVDDLDLAERTAKMQDVLFYLEKHTVKEMKSATQEDVMMAENLAEQIMAMADMMNLKEEHNYIQSHVDAIERVAK
jgi:hypothetical protein